MYVVNQTPENKALILEKIIEYLEKYTSGECIYQNDKAYLEAPELLAELADEVVIFIDEE